MQNARFYAGIRHSAERTYRPLPYCINFISQLSVPLSTCFCGCNGPYQNIRPWFQTEPIELFSLYRTADRLASAFWHYHAHVPHTLQKLRSDIIIVISYQYSEMSLPAIFSRKPLRYPHEKKSADRIQHTAVYAFKRF